MFCERGIRTFETYTRNTLDLSTIPIIKRESHCPIVIDPSQGAGRADLVSAMCKGAVAMGACVVERHITLDRAMWGSDQAASLGPSGLVRLIRDIRLMESSMGDGVKRVAEREWPIIKKLRRVGA